MVRTSAGQDIARYLIDNFTEESNMSSSVYDFRSRLAVRLACKFTDILFKHEDAIINSNAASAVFDKLADALMELDDNTLIDLVYDTRITQGEPGNE